MPHVPGPGRPTKLTKKLREEVVRLIELGANYKTTCQALNLGVTTFKRCMSDGLSHDPAKRRYRAFRSAVKRATHTLEVNCLKRIDLASMEPKHWTAAAWLLQNVVRGKYLKSAARIHKPELSFTVAEIAKELNEIPTDEISEALQIHRERFDSNGQCPSDRIIGFDPGPDHHRNGQVHHEEPVTVIPESTVNRISSSTG